MDGETAITIVCRSAQIAEQSKDRIGLIADDDDRCKLKPAYSSSVSTVESYRGGT